MKRLLVAFLLVAIVMLLAVMANATSLTTGQQHAILIATTDIGTPAIAGMPQTAIMTSTPTVYGAESIQMAQTNLSCTIQQMAASTGDGVAYTLKCPSILSVIAFTLPEHFTLKQQSAPFKFPIACTHDTGATYSIMRC